MDIFIWEVICSRDASICLVGVSLWVVPLIGCLGKLAGPRATLISCSHIWAGPVNLCQHILLTMTSGVFASLSYVGTLQFLKLSARYWIKCTTSSSVILTAPWCCARSRILKLNMKWLVLVWCRRVITHRRPIISCIPSSSTAKCHDSRRTDSVSANQMLILILNSSSHKRVTLLTLTIVNKSWCKLSGSIRICTLSMMVCRWRRMWWN